MHEVGELLPLEPLAAGEKLLAGEIDVALILASPDSPAVRQLLDDERIVLAGVIRARRRWSRFIRFCIEW
jgi:hypothetical protein